jgi:2-Cys peroxiredoxin 5
LFAGKKVVLFGLPGAFTPGCSRTHLPGYVANAERLKSEGVDHIVCLSVNDPFVMAAWGEAHQADGKVRMLADTTGAFTKALGLDIDLSQALGTHNHLSQVVFFPSHFFSFRFVLLSIRQRSLQALQRCG